MSVAAIDLVRMRRTLDLAQRLRDTPAESAIRGVWFSMAGDYVRRHGQVEALAWRSAVASRSRIPFITYPLHEYLEELAIGGAIISPDDPAEGIREIWRDATTAYTSTAFGRSLKRLLRMDPGRYLSWLANHRDHFCNYGRWYLSRQGADYATLEIEGEHIWIESAFRGGAEGMLQACGVRGSVHAELTTPYVGRLLIRWTPHS